MPRSFFEPSAQTVASDLLGCWLLRNTAEGLFGGPIVETEAYLEDDPACHAFAGKTARNRIMWGPPGFAYVYFIYGNHFCVNAVCRPKGAAEAVLIRAVEPAVGREWMRAQRPARTLGELTNGPGKLCEALKIRRELDGVDLCNSASPLFIAANPNRPEFLSRRGPVVATARIGISKAAEAPLRFCLSRSAFLSRKLVPKGRPKSPR
jgi:DNA-3-methyladenine glycosylase